MKDELDPSLFRALTNWASYLTTERNYSSHTIINYQIDIRNFLNFIGKHYGQTPDLTLLESIQAHDIRAWLASRNNQDYEFSSTSRSLSGVKNFWTYLNRNYKFSNILLINFRKPKSKKPLPKALTESQTFESLDEISNLSDQNWVNLRDKAIVSLLYSTGMRISEALSLKQEDLKRDNIIIMGKGNKQRSIYLMDKVRLLINDYIVSCPYSNSGHKTLFFSVTGRPLSPQLFNKQIRLLRRKINLPEFTTPHAFRHSFATHLLKEGADLRAIQELLGHANLSTTQRYTKIDSGKLMATYKKSHPRD